MTGKTFIVVAMVSNPDAALSPVSPEERLTIVKGPYGLFG
jgi:hypothetical protein